MRRMLLVRGRLLVTAVLTTMAIVGAFAATSSGRSEDRVGPAPKANAVPVYRALRKWESPNGRSFSTLGIERRFRLSKAGGPGQEIPALSTATSRTFEGPNGSYVAQISAAPINFQTADGKWVPINDDLASAGAGVVENRANDYRVRIPLRLDSSPVAFSAHHAKVSTQLLGASGTFGRIHGASADFANVFPEVNDRLSAGTSSLIDELTLFGRRARTTFQYRLSLSAGLRAQLRAGTVRFVNRRGKTVVAFARPFMYDASHASQGARAVPVTLTHSHRRLLLTLNAGGSWTRRALARGDRIVIDPQTSPSLSPTQSCTIDQSAPTTNECAASNDNIGWDGSHDHRTLLEFNVQGSVPRDVQVLGTHIDATLTAETSSTPISVGAYAMTAPWTTAATWNTSNGSTAWTNAGGDSQATSSDTETVGGTVGQQISWYPQSLVQGWLDGTTPNYGVILKGTSETTNNELSVDNADLYVYYEPRDGVMANQSFTSFQLNDRMSLGVNDANGNLVLKAQDLAIQGTGLSLVMDRYYNNLGSQWQIGGEDLYPNTGGIPFVYYYSSTGAVYSFRQNSNGTYTSPQGLNDTLVKDNAGQYTLTNNSTQVSEVFQGESGGNFVETSQKDQNGNTITYGYNTIDQASYNDPQQQLQSVTDTQGRKLTITNNSSDDITSITDSTGRKWSYTENSNGAITAYTDPAGNTTSYVYDSDGNLTQITSPGGRVTKIAYANEGSGDDRVTSVTQVTNNSTGAGSTTAFSYNAHPIGPCLSTDYNETIVTDPLGNKTTYCSDPNDRPNTVYDPLGHEHNYTYDVDGNVLQYGNGTGTGAGSIQTKASYNSNNSLLSVTDPTKVSATVAYGDSLHPNYATSVTDGQGSQLNYAYYSAGQTGAGTGGGNLKTIAANGSSTPLFNFSYNANGTVASETDQSGNKTTYGYDSKGNLTSVTPPTASNPTGIAQLKQTTYSVDPLSRISSMTNGNGQKTSYTYDALDRVTQITYADNSTITNTYDPDGNLIKQVDSAAAPSTETGTETWTYNSLNQVTKITLPGGQTSSYTYDADGDLTSLTDSTGTTTYGYNADNQLTSLAIPGGSCTSSPTSGCATFAYDSAGDRTSTKLPNGVTETDSYDADGHVLTIKAVNSTGTVLDSYTYSYTLNGQPTDLLQSMSDKDGNTTTYTYDDNDRLVKAATTGPAATTDTYSYGADSNRATSTDVNGTYTYAYNSDNELCWKATGTLSSPTCASPPSGATVYGYDGAGNQTSEGGDPTMTYNDRGQMNSVTFTGTGGGQSDLSYEGPGQDELASDGSYTYENNLLGPGIQHGGQYGDEDYVREPDGQLFSTYSDGQRTYPLFDGLGSLADISNSSGGSDGYFTYDPFGQELTAVNEDFNDEFGWEGAQYVEGFSHLGARFYNADEGRFTQTDPEPHPENPSQYNPYVYAADSPVTFSDPSGNSLSLSLSGCLVVCASVGVDIGNNGVGADAEVGAGPDAGVSASATDSSDPDISRGGYEYGQCGAGAEAGVESSGSGSDEYAGASSDTQAGCEAGVGYSTGAIG